jgi:ubiquinone/menaquinone biosynthesis C-methylase UbiE
MIDKMKFWDKMADKYAKKPVPNEEVYQIKKDLTREYFTPESKVFEFGCGTGSTSISHAPFVKHITATDISPEMLRIAKEKATAQGIDNVAFELWDVDADPIPGSDYDVVMAHSILHLVEDLPGAIEKSHAMLKTGGILVSSTGCLADKMWFLRPVLWFMKLIGKAPPVAFLKTTEFEQDLQAAGFQTVHSWHPKGDVAVFIISRKQ